MRRIEFWPDYGGALLHADGQPVAIEDVVSSVELLADARAWVAAYEDAKLDPSSRDETWISRGRSLFGRLRLALGERDIELVDWEGYWDAAGPGPIPGSG